MYVHQSCLDKHLIRSAIKGKCVLMNVDQDGVVSTQSEDNEQHIAYASCSICKARFEYRSPLLIETLKGMNAYIRSMAAKQLSSERESSENEVAVRTEPDTASANVNSVVMDVFHSFQQEMQFVHSESEFVQDTNAHPVIFQVFHELLKYMTPAELAKELATSVKSIRYASYIVMGCATVLTGITVNMVFS
jgi:transcription elongation factor Elf1